MSDVVVPKETDPDESSDEDPLTTFAASMTKPLADRLQRRFAVPVLIAALISVPAVFVAGWASGVVAQIGLVVDWIAGIVLWLEWLILFWAAQDRWDWCKRNKWTLAIAVLTIPALVFTLGPVQFLRVVWMVGTLRILRARRIVNASRVLHRYAHPRGWIRFGLVTVTSVLVVAFVAVLLLDPKGEVWFVARLLVNVVGWTPALILLGFSSLCGFLLWHNRKRRAASRQPKLDRDGTN